MPTIRHATCPLCEAICGLSVTVDGDRILDIRGDRDDPFSRGHICPKASALADLHHDPDRLRRPVRRVGDRWEEMSWDAALDLVADRLAAVRAEHGRDALGVYVGNPTAHSSGAVLGGALLNAVLGTKNLYTASSVDALPRLLVSSLVYGHQAALPIPDIDRTDFFLCMGANPAVSNGSIMTAPGARRRIAAIRARGGRVVVVDPRRTETAALADEHVFIRPGTDALLLLAMLHVVFAEGLATAGHLAPMIDGLERVRAAAAPWSPERVAPVTRIDADRIRALARAFARAPSAVCYGRVGTCVQRFGALTSWLIDALNAATANMDREGGAMFTTPAVDLVAIATLLGQKGSFDRWRGRTTGLPEFNGELPTAGLAAEIETPGPGAVRALLTHAGNPVLSLADGGRLERALPRLDFMVSIDIYINETTRHADVILPTTFGLEHAHYPLLMHALAVRNTARWADAAVPAAPGARHDWDILVGLAARLIARERGLLGRVGGRALGAVLGRLGPRAIIDLGLRLGPHRLSVSRLRRRPHGIDLGPLEPGRLARIVATPDRRIRLAPERLLADLPRLEERFAELASEPAEDGALLLIGRRQLHSNNSWMHNSPRLVKGRDRCTLLVHPDDAAALGIADGERVAIESRVGSIEAPARVSDEVMRGVVCLPHGWGHDRPGTRQRTARAHAGVSLNDVTDGAELDALSGASSLNGIPVRVRALAPLAV